MPDANQRHQIAVAARLCKNALARVDQNNGRVGRRGAGDHVARVLFMSGGIGNDELTPFGREEAIGHINGDALLALGREAVDQ